MILNFLATVKQINQHENTIVLSYDYHDSDDESNAYVYNLKDDFIHPIGYSAYNDRIQLEPKRK